MLQYCSHVMEGNLPCFSLGSSPIAVSYPLVTLFLDNKQSLFSIAFHEKKKGKYHVTFST
jgi:hypothetical protein